METSLPIAKINGNIARGQAHIQPGVNSWIGVCIVLDDFFKTEPEELSSTVINYEGPFNCRKYQTTGKGKAKILSISKMPQKNQLIITFEGVGEPKLKRRLKQKLKFSYDENLPLFINRKIRKEEMA